AAARWAPASSASATHNEKRPASRAPSSRTRARGWPGQPDAARCPALRAIDHAVVDAHAVTHAQVAGGGHLVRADHAVVGLHRDAVARLRGVALLVARQVLAHRGAAH